MRVWVILVLIFWRVVDLLHFFLIMVCELIRLMIMIRLILVLRFMMGLRLMLRPLLRFALIVDFDLFLIIYF